MKIDYSKILKNNMINVFRDVLKIIEKNGFKEGHHLYITFKTDDEDVIIPDWLKEKFPDKMTIIMQHEYWNFKVTKDNLNITLSFNDIKSNIKIPFDSVISFADPYANFGLKLINNEINHKKSKKFQEKKSNNKKGFKQNNIIDFNKFKKN